jgi:hypothetical protein
MGSAFIGKAKVRVALFSAGSTFENRPFRYLENVSDFQFAFAEEEKKLPDFASTAGGVDASVKRITDITGSLDMRHFTADNLALALWGTTAALAATPIVDEAGYKIVPNMFVPTKRLINTSVAPVVKKGATTILTADYTVSAGGITISSTITTGSVVSGDAITISYTPLVGADVQALINSAPDISIHVEGVNQVDGKQLIFKGYKAKLGVAQNVSLIGDDFGTLQISLTFQKDETIVTGGKSQYFELQQAT